MMANPEVFKDEIIVDELLGFFGAATDTTHNVIKTALTYLMKDNDSLKKVRDEFAKILNLEIKKDQSLAALPLDGQLKRVVTTDNCFELEFLNMVTMEALRFQPPGGISLVYINADVKLAGKFTVKKGDRIKVLNFALQRNSSEWQRPHEFLP